MANIDKETITLLYDSIITEGPSAYLLLFDNFDVWIPKSISNIDKDNKTIDVPLWLVEKEELEMYED